MMSVLFRLAGSWSASFSSKAIRPAMFWGAAASSERKTTRKTSIAASQATSTMGAVWVRKSTKVKPAAEPIITLGGSPTSVATPPVLDSRASAISNGMGLMPSISAIRIVIGAMRTTVVTLSRNRERTVVIVPRRTSRNHTLPRETFAVRIATY